jgi:hypothetical protein
VRLSDQAKSWTTGVRFPAGAEIFLFVAASRLVLRPAAAYSVSTGVKRPRREARHTKRLSSVLLRHVFWLCVNVSEENTVSIIRADVLHHFSE